MGYPVLLKVSKPSGERIKANIRRSGKSVFISLPFLEEVKKDNPPFSENGIIRIKCDQSKYAEVIPALTKYLEDLFLKELGNEDIYSSLRAIIDSGRNEEPYTERKTENDTREGDSSGICSSTGGDQSTEGSGE